MLTDTELARVVTSWKNKCGEEIRGRMCVPIEGRCEMYKQIIKTLIELHNYAIDDFEGKTYRYIVLEASIPASSRGEKKENWQKAARSDWMDALDTFFPQQILEHDSSNDPERRQRGSYEKTEYLDNDPRLEKDNPIDKSIFEGVPPVENPIDEDFLKMLKEVGNE
jgi:hypothetical protein